MATTLQPPPAVQMPGSRKVRTSQMEPEAARTGIWVGLAAITMTFAAFTSAMLVRQGSANDWRHFSLPAILYLNTLILIASSVSLHLSRRRFATALEPSPGAALPLLYTTLALGLLFVSGQYVAWLQLRSQGLYLATAPSSSFFYVFTVLHALHVLAGMGALALLISRARTNLLRFSTFSAVTQYWHFMGILWIYLLLLLRQRI
jgi:cytochrome c oxidase subunit 3